MTFPFELTDEQKQMLARLAEVAPSLVAQRAAMPRLLEIQRQNNAMHDILFEHMLRSSLSERERQLLNSPKGDK